MAYVTIKVEEIPPRVPLLGGHFTFKYKQLALQGGWLQPRGSHAYQGAKDGTNVKKFSLYAVMRALTTAAGMTEEVCKQDLLSQERKHQRLQSRDRSGGADDFNHQAGAGGLRSALKGGARSPSNRGGRGAVRAIGSSPGAYAGRAGRSPGDDRDPDVTVPASSPGRAENAANVIDERPGNA
ncbi:hypothetical protein HPB48_007826 [Haemaphysalis longicornis]|uniref:Uncharacterized protein n=1 Tax=Haemaphysalis longicornis TaxID=44386 RepID=A0A9J6GWN6_HAELO|nr:hypothetical protein HPB48_007826 [Haemaphysalis longicornis]